MIRGHTAAPSDERIDFVNEDERCPYDPINGAHCESVGTIAVQYGIRRALVCADHVQRYTTNGWTRVVQGA